MCIVTTRAVSTVGMETGESTIKAELQYEWRKQLRHSPKVKVYCTTANEDFIKVADVVNSNKVTYSIHRNK